MSQIITMIVIQLLLCGTLVYLIHCVHLTFFCFGKWQYRNPFDRTCKKCGKHQNLYEYYGDHNNQHWEDMN